MVIGYMGPMRKSRQGSDNSSVEVGVKDKGRDQPVAETGTVPPEVAKRADGLDQIKERLPRVSQ
jgi:hypothetical protein